MNFFGRLLSLAVLLALPGGWSLEANDVPVRTLPDGIRFTIGIEQVELRVASPHAFRLHVFLAGTPRRPSIYLSGVAQPTTDFTVIHEDAAVGIKTAFGELLVNTGEGTWSLRDASGKMLTDWATLGGTAGGTSEDPSEFDFTAGASPGATPHFYGSGNIPILGSLTQTEVKASPGNGTAGLPQYWSSGGYGLLTIGEDDKKPGSWKAGKQGSVAWSVPGTSVDLYLMPARNLSDWVRDDAELTGFAPVPPRWAFGYMQSRWGWTDKAYIDDAFARFRQDRLPVDVFILDFEWYTVTPDYSVPTEGDPKFIDFSWNPALLPDPPKQLADFADQNLRIVGIRKPRLGNADNLAMARRNGWILPFNPHDPNGGPARSRNLDFSQAPVQAYWEENNRKFLEAGMAAFWNDEGETNYTEYSYWNTAENDLLQQVHPGARFWSLNRSFCPGLQRFGAAVWTGDIQGDWATLARTPGELMSYGLSGMPYSVCDIGGYYGHASPELVTRWMQAGVFFPVMRSHSERTCQPHFPWLYGPEAEAVIRKALDLRYQLIPYYYSLAHEEHATALPLMRPLVMEFPDDAKAASLTDEWLMGPGLLVAPVLNQGGARRVYLPHDTWYKFGTTVTTPGAQNVDVTSKLDEVPIYVRAGTLLPLGPVLQSTDESSGDPLELQIYPGRDATFNLVEDDGKTLDYQVGKVRTTTFSWNQSTRTISWKVTGDYSGPHVFRALKVVLFWQGGRLEHQGELGQDGAISLADAVESLKKIEIKQ
jgi:alpha-glucosidase